MIHFDLDKLKKISWRMWGAMCLAAVIVPLFAVLIWQLASLNPERYCEIVKHQGVPPGDHCFQLLIQGLHIKGWVIWLLIGTLAAFVLVVLHALTKAVIAISGPNGIGLKIGESKDEPSE